MVRLKEQLRVMEAVQFEGTKMVRMLVEEKEKLNNEQQRDKSKKEEKGKSNKQQDNRSSIK